MKNLDLSIIIPVYNTSIPYLKECLGSIESANIQYSYEVIIINDGSTKTEVIEFLNNYQEKNTKIYHKENGGLSSARNEGLKYIIGDLVLCLDSDDCLLSEINQAISFLKNQKEYDVVYSDVKTFGDTDYTIVKGNFSKFKLIYIGHITSATNLFRRQVLEKVSYFNEKIVYAEDWDFWARVAAAGFKFKYLPTPYFLYRKIIDGKSVSQQNYDKREEIKSFIKSQFNPHKEITIQEINKYVLNNFNDNKKHLLKLFLILFLPSIFKFLQKKGIYKNNIVVD